MKLRKYSLSAGLRLTIILLMLIFSDFLWTQVRIKEKVVINPNPIVVSPTQSLEHTSSILSITFSFTGTLRTTYPGGTLENSFYVSHGRFSPCEVSYVNNVSGGSGSWSGSASGGEWIARAHLYIENGGTVTFDVFLGENLIRHVQYVATPMSLFIPEIRFTLYTYYNFWLERTSISPCDLNTVKLKGVADYVEVCGVPFYDVKTDIIYVSITSGNEYGKLRAPNGTLVDNLEIPFAGFGEMALEYVPSGVIPSEATDVTITADAGGVIHEVTFQILNPIAGPKHLEVQDNGHYITTGKGQNIPLVVKERDSLNNEITCDPNSLITFEIDSTRYLRFIDPNGNFVSSPLTVAYQDARTGNVKVTDTGIMPDTTIEAMVKISTPETTPIYYPVYINHPDDCVIATVDKDVVAPGDTITINVARRRYTGEIVPFPPEQLFYIFTLSNSNGLFIGTDGQIDPYYLDCTPQGIKFVASDTISVDSVKVEFYVMAANWCDGDETEFVNDCGEPYTSVWIIKPSECVDVTLLPNVLSPGDTANITILKKNDNGTTEEYPSDQLFSASFFAGAEYGTLLSADGSYVSDDLFGQVQGFKFIADSNINADSVEVLISVTLGGGASKNSFKKKTGLICEYGKVAIVGEDMCTKPSDIPTCSQSTTTIFSVVTQPNNYQGIDACTEAEENENKDVGGVFRPTVFFDYEEPISICYNEATQQYSFSVNSVDLYVIKSLCPVDGRTFIENRAQVGTIPNKNDACIDFRGHENYPITANEYLLSEFIEAHEETHRVDYNKIVQELKISMIDNLPNTIHCSQLKSRDDLNITAKELVKKRIEGFRDGIRSIWNDLAGSKEYEKSINSSLDMKIIINKWIKCLNSFYCESCKKCPILLED